MYNAFSDQIHQLSGTGGLLAEYPEFPPLPDAPIIFHLDRSKGKIKLHEYSRILSGKRNFCFKNILIFYSSLKGGLHDVLNEDKLLV